MQRKGGNVGFLDKKQCSVLEKHSRMGTECIHIKYEMYVYNSISRCDLFPGNM